MTDQTSDLHSSRPYDVALARDIRAKIKKRVFDIALRRQMAERRPETRPQQLVIARQSMRVLTAVELAAPAELYRVLLADPAEAFQYTHIPAPTAEDEAALLILVNECWDALPPAPNAVRKPRLGTMRRR